MAVYSLAMTSIARACLICLIPLSLNVHALITMEGGGSREPDAIDIHETLKQEDFATWRNHEGQPLFSDVFGDADLERLPLILTSVQMNVELSTTDLFMRSWASDGNDVAQRYFKKFVPELIERNLNFGAPRTRALAFAVNGFDVRPAAHLPHKNSVEYEGPLTLQLLTREGVHPRTNAPDRPQVITRTIEMIGITAQWQPTEGHAYRTLVLGTLNSGHVGVVKASTANALTLAFDAEDEAQLAQRLFQETHEGKVMNLRAHLLTEDLQTVVAYDLSPRVTKRLLRVGKQIFRGCQNILGSDAKVQTAR